MALDSRDKRASCLGIALPCWAVLPTPAGAVVGADRAQLAYAYRLLDLPGGAVILVRQARDLVGLWDAAHAQRDRARWLLDALFALDAAGEARLRQGAASDVLGVADSLGAIRERRQRLVEWLGGVDWLVVSGEKTRRLWDGIQAIDWIERLYLPYILDYRPLRGIRVHDSHAHGSARLRGNYLGALARAAEQHAAHVRHLEPFGSVLHQHRDATRAVLTKPLGVTVGAHRVGRSRQKRPV